MHVSAFAFVGFGPCELLDPAEKDGDLALSQSRDGTTDIIAFIGAACLQECKVSKTFGEDSDNVVFVLDKGIFNITGLVEKMTTGLTSVLGEFSSLTGNIVEAPTISPILSAVNSATALLG